MNITFLLGNGFDIGLKMPTKYEDFYKYYCIKCETDNDNIKDFKLMLKDRNKKRKEDRIIDWSDFEKAFGEHSAAPEIANVLNGKQKYLERFEDFVRSFNEYLEIVESSFDETKFSDIGEMMYSALQSFYKIRKEDENDIIRRINAFSSGKKYNFISFNYTKSVDFCVEELRKVLSKRSVGNIGEIIHIHGYLDKNMIVGVNDKSQISNPEFAEDPDIIEEIVKPQQNASSRTAYEKAMISTINNSDAICIYGMSLGETDKKWWELLSEWMTKDERRFIVLLGFSRVYDERFPFSQNKTIRKFENKFIAFSKLGEEQKKKILSRVYVGINHNIFSLEAFKEDTFKEKITEKYEDLIYDIEDYEFLFGCRDTVDEMLEQVFEPIHS